MKFSAEYPDQLGIGIDEETALIVKGDHIQVIEQGTVSVYDGRRRAANAIVVRSGDRYDLATRK